MTQLKVKYLPFEIRTLNKIVVLFEFSKYRLKDISVRQKINKKSPKFQKLSLDR